MAKTYSEKLQDPRWQRKRLEVFSRDDFKCCLCQDDKTTLHVHHEEYNGEPWEAPIDRLKTLCAECHFSVELWKAVLITNPAISAIKIPYRDRRGNAVVIKTNDGLLLTNAADKDYIVHLTNDAVKRLYSMVGSDNG